MRRRMRRARQAGAAVSYPHGGKYSDDPYFMTAEEEAREEALIESENRCQYCDGSGFFYSEPDLGPCTCVLDAAADQNVS